MRYTGARVLSPFSRVHLFANLWTVPGSSLHGILQEKILEWVAFLSPGDLPDPGIESESLASPALAGGFFTPSTTWEAQFNLTGILIRRD